MAQSISLDIIDAIAEHRGVDPLDLEYSLEDHIDTDAIEALQNHETATYTLTFELPECEVTITDEGSVLVKEKSTT